MKMLMTKISAALLIVWYCMSIIGFGVHTCSGSGRTFVVSFAESTSCADIHPEHHCCKGCAKESHCCQSEHHSSESDEHCTVDVRKCCSNEYQMILLSGCRSSVESDSDQMDSEPLCTSLPTCSASDLYAEIHADNLQFWDSGTGEIVICDRLSAYGIWRI